LLLLLLGQATRLARFIPSAPKTYQGVLELGVVTTSDDLSGDVLRRHEGLLPSGSEILAAAASRVGRQLQVPPAFSARHVDGKRLYRSARRGVVVEAPPSEVVIDRFHLAPTEAEHLWTYELVVSTGTYVRAVVRDLGAALGCGAAVASLRRTAIGPFRVEDALTLPAGRVDLRAVAEERVVPIDALPLDLRAVSLTSPADAAGFCAGRAIASSEPPPADPSLVAVRDALGRLLGVGVVSDGTVRPRVVLPRLP
jgi:tRNA pseudouridine55 synthase